MSAPDPGQLTLWDAAPLPAPEPARPSSAAQPARDLEPDPEPEQLVLGELWDEREAAAFARALALDVLEWRHQFGGDAVPLERWAVTFRDTDDYALNERQWLKLRERFAHHGVPFELREIDHPGQARRVLLALPPAAGAWAAGVLDQGRHPDDETEEDSMHDSVTRCACGAPTRGEKPWCPDHADASPYAREVMAGIERYEREAELIAQRGKVDPLGLVTADVLTVAANADVLTVSLAWVAHRVWLLDEGGAKHVLAALGVPTVRHDGASHVLRHRALQALERLERLRERGAEEDRGPAAVPQPDLAPRPAEPGAA